MVFDPHKYAQDRAAAASEERLVGQLREALAAGLFELHYQPIVDLRADREGAGGVHAVEAPGRGGAAGTSQPRS